MPVVSWSGYLSLADPTLLRSPSPSTRQSSYTSNSTTDAGDRGRVGSSAVAEIGQLSAINSASLVRPRSSYAFPLSSSSIWVLYLKPSTCHEELSSSTVRLYSRRSNWHDLRFELSEMTLPDTTRKARVPLSVSIYPCSDLFMDVVTDRPFSLALFSPVSIIKVCPSAGCRLDRVSCRPARAHGRRQSHSIPRSRRQHDLPLQHGRDLARPHPLLLRISSRVTLSVSRPLELWARPSSW